MQTAVTYRTAEYIAAGMAQDDARLLAEAEMSFDGATSALAVTGANLYRRDERCVDGEVDGF